MTTRVIVRCTEGHPYDRNAHEVCPVCGAPPAGTVVTPTLQPSSRPFGPVGGIVGGAIIGGAVVLIAVALLLYKPAKPTPVTETATTTETKTDAPADAPQGDAAKSDAPKGDTAKGDAGKGDAVKEGAPQSEAKTDAPQTIAKPGPTPDVGSLAQNLKHPPETDAEAAARITKFATVDSSIVEPLKHAMSPIDPKDVDPLLLMLCPHEADALHLSLLLREMLLNQSANLAYGAHNIARVKTLLSALASEPPLAPGVIPIIAHKNLAYLLSQDGDPQADPAAAGRLALTAAKQGFAPAAQLLNSRPNMVAAAGIDPATLNAVLKLAALQDPQMSPVAAQHGIDTGALDAERKAFYAALQRRDWPAALTAQQSIGEPQIPALDMRFARALLFDKDYARFLDRSLVGSVSGTMAFYPVAMDSLSFYSEYGLDGVVKDAPNAAVWMMLALKGAAANDTGWNNTRNRYAKIKQMLTPEQGRIVAQLAQEIGAP